MVKVLESKAKAKAKAKKEAKEAKEAKAKQKFDFVGHLTLPYKPKVQELVFYPNVMKLIDVVKRDGKTILRQKLEADCIEYLKEVGYTVEQDYRPAPNAHVSIHSISIKCDNAECPYFDELYNKECKIKIRANVELPMNSRKAKDSDKRIVINYKTRDMMELGIKTYCLRQYVFEQTDEMGEQDTYGKMEIC